MEDAGIPEESHEGRWRGRHHCIRIVTPNIDLPQIRCGILATRRHHSTAPQGCVDAAFT